MQQGSLFVRIGSPSSLKKGQLLRRVSTIFGYSWVELISNRDNRVAASEIRHAISELLEKAGIITFPQRDVHVDSSKPLEVKVVSVEGEGKKE